MLAAKPSQPTRTTIPNKRDWGLCAFCKHNAECMFPRNPEQQIIHCDEFEGWNALNGESLKAVINGNHSHPSSIAILKGLCVTCKFRQKCIFPKPEDGVWHCEEYR